MKYLPIVLLVFTGCSESDHLHLTDASKLKFFAGQGVKTDVSFYSKCEGIVEDYTRYTDDREGPRYSVSFYCGIGQETKKAILLESSLRAQ